MWQDNVNGLFELCGGIFVALHCLKLYRDKKVRGVSFVATGYFAAWGFWNMYYYPFLEQWASLVGGLLIVAMNTLWISMMFYYIRKERKEVSDMIKDMK